MVMGGQMIATGFRMDRGRMRLSVVSHIRAAQRRRTISEATAQGITHFRLDVPQKYLGRIAPDGLLGRNLWRVRTIDEWQAITSSANAKQIGSSAFDTLGMGFGDVSYLVSVPAIYIDDAIAHGEKLRKRWLTASTAN